MFHELSRHPDIYPSVVKEPFYFRPYINGKELAPLEDYLSNFKGSTDELYRMEGSPTYIYGAERAAKVIAETLGQVKSIISIRNPVDQLFSLYKHHLRFMKIPKDQTFQQFVDSKDDFSRQFYDIHLQAWFETFGDDVKCVFFDDLVRTPENVLHDITDWLGLKPLVVQQKELGNTNPGETYRFQTVHRFALMVFHRSQRLLPHNLFVQIRKRYYKLNGRRLAIRLEPEDRAAVTPIFTDHNRKLHQLLSSKGYKNLPEWMSA